jgi:hypothetical protein
MFSLYLGKKNATTDEKLVYEARDGAKKALLK